MEAILDVWVKIWTAGLIVWESMINSLYRNVSPIATDYTTASTFTMEKHEEPAFEQCLILLWNACLWSLKERDGWPFWIGAVMVSWTAFLVFTLVIRKVYGRPDWNTRKTSKDKNTGLY